ncbi:hypothetical protein OB13_18705 [Pontibacter sp. HJ8]
MDQALNNSSSAIEGAHQEKVRWGKTIWFFTLQGVFSYFTLKQDYFLNWEADLPPLIITLVILGFLYGCVSNFIICYLIKITGRLFKAEASYNAILNTFTLAYWPHLYSVAIIIIQVIMAYYYESNFIHDNKIVLAFFLIVLKLIAGVLAIWILIRLIKGMALVQKLTVGYALLNFLAAALLFTPIYYLLLYKF